MAEKDVRSAANPTEAQETVLAAVRERYGSAARQAASGKTRCCGGTQDEADFVCRGLYDPSQVHEVPAEALRASLGCGNPTALAELVPGQVVLDLGSGGGIDVLLSARRVGPEGKAYGVDMTDDMLALARENQRKAGVTNAEFLKGRIEAVPLPDASVDVVISNCVLALSVDKPRVFAEAFRVLRPGGLLAVSDIVARGEVPPEIRHSLEAYLGCFAGALEERECMRLMHDAGFDDVSVTPTRVYSAEDARSIVAESGLDPALADRADGRFMSAFLRARKPAASGGATSPALAAAARTEPCDLPTYSSAKLDERTKELIAVGSSVAANCQPCLEHHRGRAAEVGASRAEIEEAIAVGRTVRKGAASKMDAYVKELAAAPDASSAKPDGACGCGS